MKKLSIISTMFFLSIFLLGGTAMALTITYSPNPEDVYDLPHWKAYEWGIDATCLEDALNSGATLLSATLTFEGIYNEDDSSNVLYANLLDNDEGFEGLTTYYDSESEQVNLFDGQGLLLMEEHDLSTTPTTITYVFDETSLAALYAAIIDNGFFSITFDPDCHYFNDGISLTVETSPVPEPATMFLFGTGMVAFAGVARRQRKKKTA